mmetsp:Transcript_10895/g.20716  ORF Transcript_10895/g.20716 Transcript_10895/m.20716 type:complete len:415 (-) Transcript_10895:21-1265(-)
MLLWTLFILATDVIAVPVVLGNMVLRNGGYQQLQGERIAVLSNPTGVFSDSFEHIVDAMHFNTSLQVQLILGPEHGFRGEKQAETGDPDKYIDSVTGLPVYSAYKISPANMSAIFWRDNITAVVVDLQDVGVRLYTFIWTMFQVMTAGAITQTPPKFVILDRPNPLGGELVDGPLLNLSCCTSGYGRAPITHVHGMTIGELALFFNSFMNPKLPSSKLEVIKMTGWQRSMTFPETGLPWIPPSPNIPTFNVATAYLASVFLEATSLAEGRGTTTPFLLFGAPFLDAQVAARDLNIEFGCSNLACFRPAYFEPTFFKYNKTVVQGVQWVETRSSVNFLAATKILVRLKALSPAANFSWDGSWFGHPGKQLIDHYAGTPVFREMIDMGMDAESIYRHFSNEISQFDQTRKRFLLYT